ncbi:LytTR family DNA-binding domain-containing protein [Spongiimicrobium salis]|uniref:LytTR family DNA-binding domain-containing protein n=1 Tax=Spongiimicrobium salis TaxID=1667022 RepID=UPI00374DD5B1
MNLRFPFQPVFKAHILLALGLALWIFGFLYFTEPLDVDEFGDQEKLIYLPLYGLTGAIAYLCMLPFQRILYRKEKEQWFLRDELLFFIVFVLGGFLLSRGVYRYIIVPNEPNPYTLYYYLSAIYLPAIAVMLPIIIIGRWGMGKYYEKKQEDLKVKINGEGNYEGLALALHDIICIKADDNYIEVSYIVGAEVKKQLIRNRLSSVEKDLDTLCRTHRSYLINPYHFVQWKMDKGKTMIQLNHNIFVPVSKTYAPSLKTMLNSTTN